MTEYIDRNRTKPFPAIQWTGDNQNEVWLWALAIKKESASVGQTSYAHLGAALLVHVDHCEQSVGKGAWLVWRWDTLFGMSDQSFREQYEPVAGDYYAEAFVGGLSGTNLPTDEEQARQAKRCADATRSAMAENKARDENAEAKCVAVRSITDLRDPNIIYYGPHECPVCGRMIVKMSIEQGGHAFDAHGPREELIYPNGTRGKSFKWVTHTHAAEETQRVL